MLSPLLPLDGESRVQTELKQILNKPSTLTHEGTQLDMELDAIISAWYTILLGSIKYPLYLRFSQQFLLALKGISGSHNHDEHVIVNYNEFHIVRTVYGIPRKVFIHRDGINEAYSCDMSGINPFKVDFQTYLTLIDVQLDE